jgi:hypothetical protein
MITWLMPRGKNGPYTHYSASSLLLTLLHHPESSSPGESGPSLDTTTAADWLPPLNYQNHSYNDDSVLVLLTL